MHWREVYLKLLIEMKQGGVAANGRDFLIFVETAIFMRKYLFLIGLMVLLGCNQKRQKPPYLLVELAGPSASSIQLQYLLKDFQPFDTAAVNDKGMWEFTKDSVPAGFYQLVVDSKPISRLVISDEAPTRIKISGEEFIVSIVGSPETKAIVQIERIVAKLSGILIRWLPLFMIPFRPISLCPCEIPYLIVLKSSK